MSDGGSGLIPGRGASNRQGEAGMSMVIRRLILITIVVIVNMGLTFAPADGAAAAAAPQPLQYLCVQKSSGILSYVTALSQCTQNESPLTLSASAPLYGCVLKPDSTVRKVANLSECSGGQGRLTLPGAADTSFCAAGIGKPIHLVTAPNKCPKDRPVALVVPKDQPPTAAGQSVTVIRNTPKSITLAATDPDGAALTFAIVANPTKGALGAVDALTCAPSGPPFGPPEAMLAVTATPASATGLLAASRSWTTGWAARVTPACALADGWVVIASCVAPWTVIATVAVLELTMPSEARKVKLSGPW